MQREPQTRIYNKDDDLRYVEVSLRLTMQDLEHAYELVELARSLNPRSHYGDVTHVLEWAVYRGLSGFLPGMFQEMDDNGELEEGKADALIDFYNDADYETRQDIINLKKALD